MKSTLFLETDCILKIQLILQISVFSNMEDWESVDDLIQEYSLLLKSLCFYTHKTAFVSSVLIIILEQYTFECLLKYVQKLSF